MKRTCLHTITNTNEQNSCEFHPVEQLFEKRNLDPKDNQFVKNFARMKTNKVLRFSAVFFKFLMGTALAGVILVTFVLIHSEFHPTFYGKYTVEIDKGININHSKSNPLPPETFAEYTNSKDKTIYFSKLSFGSKFSIWVWVIIACIISILTLKELIRFVQSIKKYDSFFIDNSKVFKRISVYYAVSLVLYISMFFWSFDLEMIFPDGIMHRLSGRHFDFTYSIIISSLWFLSTILSQVFKEGERMKQEHELTI